MQRSRIQGAAASEDRPGPRGPEPLDRFKAQLLQDDPWTRSGQSATTSPNIKGSEQCPEAVCV